MGATPGPLHPHRTRDTAMLLRRTNLPFFFFFFFDPQSHCLSFSFILVFESFWKRDYDQSFGDEEWSPCEANGVFEEELGFGRREKRIVGIRRVLGLGRGIRVLDKPHLYPHRERERERKYRLVLLSSCRAVCTILTKNITHSPLTLACTCTSALSLSLSLSLSGPECHFKFFQILPVLASCGMNKWNRQLS